MIPSFSSPNIVGIHVYYDGKEELDIITACIHPNNHGTSWIMHCPGKIVGHFECTFYVPYEMVLNAPGFSVIGFQCNEVIKKAKIIWEQHYFRTVGTD